MEVELQHFPNGWKGRLLLQDTVSAQLFGFANLLGRWVQWVQFLTNKLKEADVGASLSFPSCSSGPHPGFCQHARCHPREERAPSTLRSNWSGDKGQPSGSAAGAMCAVIPWCHCAFLPPTRKTMEPELPGSVPKERKNGQYKLDGGKECRGLLCTQGATVTLASQSQEGQWPGGTGRSSTLRK